MPSGKKRETIKRFFGDYRLVYKTTWKFRITLVLVLCLIFLLSRGSWGPVMGRCLVCNGQTSRCQAIIVANFDVDYPLFERAGELQRAGLGDRVIIPVRCSKTDERKVNAADKEIASALSRLAQIRDPQYVPVEEKEPISLNVAKQLGQKLAREGIHSVILVTQGFRSRRDLMIHKKVFSSKGVKVFCEPVFGEKTPENWMYSWHGVQEVFLQSGKLLYYQVKLWFAE